MNVVGVPEPVVSTMDLTDQRGSASSTIRGASEHVVRTFGCILAAWI